MASRWGEGPWGDWWVAVPGGSGLGGRAGVRCPRVIWREPRCSGWGSVLVVEVWRGLVAERREEWVEPGVAGRLPVGWGRYVVGVARWGCDRVSS